MPEKQLEVPSTIPEFMYYMLCKTHEREHISMYTTYILTFLSECQNKTPKHNNATITNNNGVIANTYKKYYH